MKQKKFDWITSTLGVVICIWLAVVLFLIITIIVKAYSIY